MMKLIRLDEGDVSLDPVLDKTPPPALTPLSAVPAVPSVQSSPPLPRARRSRRSR